MEYVDAVLEFMRAGYDQVNRQVLGLVIALVAALLMPSWGRLPLFALAATVVHILAEVLEPLVTNAGAVQLPEVLEPPFWQKVAFLLVGYFIIIGLLAFIKRLIFKR